MKKNSNLVALHNQLYNRSWAILPSAHKSMCDLLTKLMDNGEYPTGVFHNPEAHELDKPFDTQIEEVQEEAPVVAIVEVNGVLMKHPTSLDIMMGAMDVDVVRTALLNAVEDENVKSIVLWFNSPGGVTTGIEELGRCIVHCDSIKPVYAFTDSIMASAAYWLGSQARAVIITPSAVVGSVGVFALVLNNEKELEQSGVKITPLYSGKYKLMGHTFHTLTEEEQKILQADVDNQHVAFKNTVKSRRPNISEDDMEGLTYEGEAAVEAHYADATVDSIEEFLTNIENDMKKNTKTASVEKSEPTLKNATAKVKVATVATVEKVAGKYDGKYQTEDSAEEEKKGGKVVDPKDPNRDTANQKPEEGKHNKYQEEADYDSQYAEEDAQKIPGLTGVNEEEEDGDEHEEPDGDECVCEACGSTYKAKKAKHVEIEESEEEESEEEEEDQGVVPAKKMESEEEEEEEEEESEEEEEDGSKPVKKMAETAEPKFEATLANWKTAVSTVASRPPLEMKKANNNLLNWRAAQDSIRNQK